MKIRATAAIMECLLEQGVDTVFGYPGGTILIFMTNCTAIRIGSTMS